MRAATISPSVVTLPAGPTMVGGVPSVAAVANRHVDAERETVGQDTSICVRERKGPRSRHVPACLGTFERHPLLCRPMAGLPQQCIGFSTWSFRKNVHGIRDR